LSKSENWCNFLLKTNIRYPIMTFCDRVKPVGRPRIEENVVNPCLRLTDNTSDPNGCMRGATVWHKSVESSYGLNVKEVEPIYKQNKS
jgi:hypothetical protein